jgi:hypothetical protein
LAIALDVTAEWRDVATRPESVVDASRSNPGWVTQMGFRQQYLSKVEPGIRVATAG